MAAINITKNIFASKEGIVFIDKNTMTIYLKKCVVNIKNKTLFDAIVNLIEGKSSDTTVYSGDLTTLGDTIFSGGFTGKKTFTIAGSDVTAFGSETEYGSSVDVIFTSDLYSDKSFDYGFRFEGQSYQNSNGNFYAPTQAIVAQSYADLIANASSVTDKTITISTESAKMLAEYCRYRGQQTRNLAFGGSYSGTNNGVTISYDNGLFTFSGEATGTTSSLISLYKNYFTLQAGSYIFSTNCNFSCWITLYSKDNTTGITSVNTSSKTALFTITEDIECFIGIYLPKATFNNTLQVQIELGTTATDFVPPLVTNTTIADANAKGFKVKALLADMTYEILPSLSMTNSYVDSGVNPTNDTTIELDGNTNIVGQFLIGKTGSDKMVIGSNASGTRFDYCSTSTTVDTYISSNNRAVYALLGNKAYANGNLLHTFTESTFSASLPLYIGCLNDNGTAIYCSNATIYSLLLNSELYIPANNGTTNGLLNLTTKEFKPLQSV